jgi:hypothetical protein
METSLAATSNGLESFQKAVGVILQTANSTINEAEEALLNVLSRNSLE